jgi:hypothetical protein
MLVYALVLVCYCVLTQATVIPDDIKQQLIRLNTSISDNSCSFFSELDKLIPCGDDGYVLHFAYHYCQVYLDNRNSFTDRSWLDATRRCLQVKMYQFVTQQENYPSCERIQKFGFDSHPICYEKPDESKPNLSFCRTSLVDKMRVAWLAAGGALMELLHGAAALKFCL